MARFDSPSIHVPGSSSFASLPRDLVNNRASGSVVDSCVWFLRFSPRKSTSPPTSGGFPDPSLGRKTLMTGPSFDQRSVHREMLIRHVRLGTFQHPLEKRFRNLFVQQTLPILAAYTARRISTPSGPSPSLRTTGTIGCTVAVRSAFARCVPNKRSATAAISTVALAQSRKPTLEYNYETSATSLLESRPLSCAAVAADDAAGTRFSGEM